MANKFQVKRTAISARTPNTTNSGNTHYIDTGELALNLADGKLFSSNGTAYFEVGANLANLSVASNATLKAIIANGSIGGVGQTLTSNGTGVYWAVGAGSGTVTQVNTGIGLSGGPITSTGTIEVVANNGLVANSTGVFANPGTGVVVNATGIHVNSAYIGTLAANSATYLGGNTASDLRSYSDTQSGAAYTNATTFAANADNISSGTLNASRLPATVVQNTDSRTLSGNLVISGTYFNPSANTILLGNSTQRWVLSANTGSFSGQVSGITTLAAGNTTITGFANASVSVNSALLTVGTSFIANTIGVYHTGTINAASHNTTGVTANVTGVYPTTNTSGSALGASAQRWVVNANTINASGLITGSAGANVTGTVDLVDVNISGNLTVSGTTTYIDTTNLNVGDNIVTLNADLPALSAPTENAGLEINRGSSANVNFLWNESSDSWTLGNTNITGYANASVSVNSALLTVGTSFIANTTGAYHTGVVNASSHTTSGITANSSGVFPSSNTVGTTLGSATKRWVLVANTGSFTGQVEINGNSWNTATGAGALYLDSSTGNRIDWNIEGVAAPSTTTRSAGTKLVLYPGVAAAAVDFGLGIETNHMWFSAADTGDGFKWYANTTEIMSSNTTGAYHIGSVTATSFGSGVIGAANGFVATSSLVSVGNSTVNSSISGSQIQGNQNDTVSVPYFSWSSDNNTGLYRPGADVIGVTTGGVERVRVGTTLLINTSANASSFTVGSSFIANTTGAYHTGTVNASSFTVGSSFIANTTGAYHTGTVNAASFTVGTMGAASNSLVATSSAIAVGNTSVNTEITPLQIRANQNDTVSAPSYTWSGNTTTGFYRPATDTIAITVGGTEELRVNNSLITVNTNMSVGNTTSGYINVGRVSPTAFAGYQQEKHFSADTTTFGTFVDTLLNNTAYTAARSHYGGYYLTTANTLSQNTLGSTISTDLYGTASFLYNAETTGGDSRLNDMMSVYSDARNYANGLVANSVDNMWAYRGLARNFRSGVITNAYGVGVVVGAGNTTSTGNITTAYGVSSVISSNTASTIGTGYLFYGSHTGATTTTKYGVFITGESNNYFSSNVSVAGSLALTGQFVANGTSGTSGQVLTTNATGTYWSNVSGGLTIVNDTSTNATRYISFNESTSGSTSNLGVSSTKLTFNPSTGIVSATQFSATSDERLKQNVEVIDNPLDKISQLKGVTFNYIGSNQAGVGVIAQDVEKIFPELVDINSEGYKSVLYDGLIGLLIESIKDQQMQIEELKQEIKRLN